MGKVVNRYKDSKLKISGKEIVDPSTGEVHDLGNDSLYKRSDEKKININYKNYIYLDSDALMKILKLKIRQIDLSLLVSISNNLKINHNICLDNNDDPLNTKNIGDLVNNSEQAVQKKINNLVDANLLYHGKVKGSGFNRKVYIVNPHFIKRGVKLEKFLSGLFDGI